MLLLDILLEVGFELIKQRRIGFGRIRLGDEEAETWRVIEGFVRCAPVLAVLDHLNVDC